jgi:phosphoribosylamine--glycine ligase
MARDRILVIGSGGREHALAWRLARDPEAPEVFVAPGNPGIARAFPCIDLSPEAPALIDACRGRGIGLAVVGPEAPLAHGLADALSAAGIDTFGPSAAAARLESSKWFAKEVMAEAGVRTARAEVFDAPRAAREALPRFGPTWVVKQDGLAAGKGVTVSDDLAVAEAAIEAALANPGARVVLEECLNGEEASVMAVCDGRSCVALPPARDYKRAHDGDRGPNTGGMGAVAPSPAVGPALEAEAVERAILPVVRRMAERGTPFRGVLYAGIMLTGGGASVIEFNVRFGDPEAEVVLPLLEGSLSRLLRSAARGHLEADAVSRGTGSAVGVVLAARGYPESPQLGGRLVGLDRLMETEDIDVFHAATSHDGVWRVRGGRAAHVVAKAPTVAEARARVYAALDTLSGEGWVARRDIAAEPAARLAAAR